MTRRARAGTVITLGVIAWFGGWYFTGAVAGVDLGDGNMLYGTSGGVAAMVIAVGAPLFAALLGGAFLLVAKGVMDWIDAGDK